MNITVIGTGYVGLVTGACLADAGNQVAVVVSAMAGETDRLVQMCREAAPLYDPREYDVVVASGEQVTAGLLAMTLQNMGLKARSFMGWQLVRAAGRNLGIEAKTSATGGGCDANVLNKKGLEVANLSTGMREMHTVKEWLDLNDLYISAQILVEILRLNAKS